MFNRILVRKRRETMKKRAGLGKMGGVSLRDTRHPLKDMPYPLKDTIHSYRNEIHSDTNELHPLKDTRHPLKDMPYPLKDTIHSYTNETRSDTNELYPSKDTLYPLRDLAAFSQKGAASPSGDGIAPSAFGTIYGIARRGRRPRRPATPIIPSIAMRVGDAMHRVSTGGASRTPDIGASRTPPPTGDAVYRDATRGRMQYAPTDGKTLYGIARRDALPCVSNPQTQPEGPNLHNRRSSTCGTGIPLSLPGRQDIDGKVLPSRQGLYIHPYRGSMTHGYEDRALRAIAMQRAGVCNTPLRTGKCPVSGWTASPVGGGVLDAPMPDAPTQRQTYHPSRCGLETRCIASLRAGRRGRRPLRAGKCAASPIIQIKQII
jgi:hypothetical protein